MINEDMVKALRCMVSETEKYSCYASQWNDTTPENPNKMTCTNIPAPGTICCPYYQDKYITCYEDYKISEWVNELADDLEQILEKKGGNGTAMSENILKPCPVCGAQPFISRDAPDGFYMGWSVGCPRYSINDGVHGINDRYADDQHSYVKHYLDSQEECEEWWRKRVEQEEKGHS